jgi:hypothetical protein
MGKPHTQNLPRAARLFLQPEKHRAFARYAARPLENRTISHASNAKPHDFRTILRARRAKSHADAGRGRHPDNSVRFRAPRASNREKFLRLREHCGSFRRQIVRQRAISFNRAAYWAATGKIRLTPAPMEDSDQRPPRALSKMAIHFVAVAVPSSRWRQP